MEAKLDKRCPRCSWLSELNTDVPVYLTFIEPYYDTESHKYALNNMIICGAYCDNCGWGYDEYKVLKANEREYIKILVTKLSVKKLKRQICQLFKKN